MLLLLMWRVWSRPLSASPRARYRAPCSARRLQSSRRISRGVLARSRSQMAFDPKNLTRTRNRRHRRACRRRPVYVGLSRCIHLLKESVGVTARKKEVRESRGEDALEHHAFHLATGGRARESVESFRSTSRVPTSRYSPGKCCAQRAVPLPSGFLMLFYALHQFGSVCDAA